MLIRICFLSIALYLFLISGVSAQKKVETTSVPENIASAFKTAFPSASNVIWRKAEKREVYAASFTQDGQKMHVAYGPQGEMVRKVTPIQTNALPAAIAAAIKTGYPGYTVKHCHQIQKTKKGDSLYRVKLVKSPGKEKAMVVYTADGKVAPAKILAPEDSIDPDDEK